MEANLLPKWMMQTLGMLLIIFLVFASVYLFRTFCTPPNVMRVSAEGKVTTVPDKATINVGVVSEGMDIVTVKNKNNQKMNQIISFIKQQNIASKDIQTTAFYASPKYNYQNGQNTIVGYQANQTITITIIGIDQSKTQLQKILGDVVNHGANNIQGVSFGFTNTDKIKALALTFAIKNAKEKARALAQDANLKLGNITNVIEGPSETRNPIPRMQLNTYAVQAKSVEPNIEPGSQEITESISLLFEVYRR